MMLSIIQCTPFSSGGIAQYYEVKGLLVQDNNVPFVKTISRVTRTADGKMTEYKMPVEMPAFLGAGAEFIPAHSAHTMQYGNGVFKLEKWVSDSTHVGYIYGGINSTNENIFWTNDGTQSTALDRIYKVLFVKKSRGQKSKTKSPEYWQPENDGISAQRKAGNFYSV